MTYRTCTGCVFGTGYCHAREVVKAHVKGIGVTSLKWRCEYRRPVYQPGDAVWANLFTGWEDGGDSWGREEQAFAEFPGVVIRVKGSKAVVFIEPGASSECEQYDFEPLKNGNGYVKIPLIRTRKRDALREHVCDCCGQVVRLKGHHEEYRCNIAPVRTPEQEYPF
jgi:hypothetical protein